MPVTQLRIFISSAQKEFAQVRRDLQAFLLGDAVLRRFVSSVFLFEELPASDTTADRAFLDEVARCDIYLAIFGNEYGSEDAEGISPTEREYDEATRRRKTRLIYVWGAGDRERHPKMKRLIKKASHDLIRRRVSDESALRTEVYASLVDYLDRRGALRVPPFDTTGCEGATIKSISRERVDWFIRTARKRRSFPLTVTTETPALLTHLNLLDGRKPTNAAVLLFGARPQQFHAPAVIKCIQSHGTEYQRPFASLQVYEGDLFAQADFSRDFILQRINRAVGTRGASMQASVTYEFPPEAVDEVIINALAHRDYHSRASVEVRLFGDRLEVWNPGSLPGTLTISDLTIDHPSIPQNPLIAESLYLAGYIERVGSGTQRIAELCRKADLPPPDFEQRGGSFVVTLWRQWLTDSVLDELALNDRQRQAIEYLLLEGSITNREYQKLTNVARRTALRDMQELVSRGLLEQSDTTGRAVSYRLKKRRGENAP